MLENTRLLTLSTPRVSRSPVQVKTFKLCPEPTSNFTLHSRQQLAKITTMDANILIYMGTALATIILLLAVLWFWRRPAWMGLQDRTLWDWMTMLALPVMVTFGATGLGFVQQALERGRSDELAVQQFVDRISDAYALDVPSSTTLAVARAQTRAVLRLVAQDRAGHVLAFLSDLGALQDIKPNLEFLDLTGAEFKALDLSGMDFEGSILRDAEFEEADLQGADFEDADLMRADFKDADMRGANFEGAVLSNADLAFADLRDTDLSLAFGLNANQLGDACLNVGTVLPAGLVVTPATGRGCNGTSNDD